MKTSHTPGPWKVDNGMISMRDQADILRDSDWVAVGPGDEEVPELPACVVALCHPINARLITAAPELLEIALRALEYAPNEIEANKCRAAIAKATQP